MTAAPGSHDGDVGLPDFVGPIEASISWRQCWQSSGSLAP